MRDGVYRYRKEEQWAIDSRLKLLAFIVPFSIWLRYIGHFENIFLLALPHLILQPVFGFFDWHRAYSKRLQFHGDLVEVLGGNGRKGYTYDLRRCLYLADVKTSQKQWSLVIFPGYSLRIDPDLDDFAGIRARLEAATNMKFRQATA